MTYNPVKHHRRSIRLQGYDYSSAGAYFVTICAKDRAGLFGDVVDGEMVLNPIGQIVDDEWRLSPTLRDEIDLDEWVVMPNHMHGIVVIDTSRRRGDRLVARDDRLVARDDRLVARGDRQATGGDRRATGGDRRATGGDRPVAPTTNGVGCGPKPRSLGAFIAGFKSAATKRINEFRGTPRVPVWQRNYHERIIRDADELHRIRQYIIDNPARWDMDRDNSDTHQPPTKMIVGAVREPPFFWGLGV